MKWTGLNDLREMYLSFFESKGHLRHKSFPLVQSGQYSMTQIANMVGFSNASRFAIAFRKMFGCNPREYNSLKGRENNS